MPPKKDTKGKDAKAKPSQKKTGTAGGGKAKKKKWSKGKVRDKLSNMVLFDQSTYDKLYKEVVTYKLITPSVVSERLKVRVSLAKAALRELLAKGLIRLIVCHSSQLVYTRNTVKDDTVEVAGGEDGEKPKPVKKGKAAKEAKEAAKEAAIAEQA